MPSNVRAACSTLDAAQGSLSEVRPGSNQLFTADVSADQSVVYCQYYTTVNAEVRLNLKFVYLIMVEQSEGASFCDFRTLQCILNFKQL